MNKKLKNKWLVSIKELKRETEYKNQDYGVSSIHPIQIQYKNNKDDKTVKEFIFYLANSNNGYYESYFYMNYMPEENKIKTTNSKIVIIIGLPGSGKTHLLKEYYKNGKNGYKIYDDIDLSMFEDHSKYLITNLKKGNNVCISQPLFTVFDLFIQFLNDYFYDYTKITDNIEVILFENNPQKAINNLIEAQKKEKYKYPMILQQKINSVNNLTQQYDLTKYNEFSVKKMNIYNKRKYTRKNNLV
jgi:GTPase SAR1 family protein